MSGRRLPWLAVVAGVAAMVIAWAPAAAAPAVGVVPVPVPVLLPAPGSAPGAPPQRLLLPGLGVDAGVTPVEVDPGGALQVPPDPDLVGWWRDGARPGSSAGTVVLAGHVDTRADGPGALFRIAELRPGQSVLLHTAGGELRYVVRAVRSYPKALLPPEVFARSGTPRLVLISCGGPFDVRLRHYADNVVVYAVPET